MFKKWISVLAIGTIIFSSTTMSVLAAERHEQVMLGDSDKWVKQIQESLIDKNLLSENATGYYGTQTQAGIIKLQQEEGLSVDGIAGPKTRKALLGEEYEAIPSSRAVDDTQEDTVIYPEDRGEMVTQIQQRLVELEYLKAEPTGYYGPLTQQAIQQFQRAMGLEQDGICGELTYSMLNSDLARYYVMEKQDQGEDIQALQQRLQKLGYFSKEDTGYFGEITEDAVKEFQQENGLAADGKAGKQTRRALYSQDAKANTQETKEKAPKKSRKTEHPKEQSKSTTKANKSDKPKASKNKPDKKKNTQKTNEDSGSVSSFISLAKKQLGNRYVLGATGPSRFDCSGFVYYCLRNSGVSTSRLTAATFSQVSKWDKISSVSKLKKGDLVFFRSDGSSRISHCGIYIGGGQMIHASASKGKVLISSMSDYWQRNFVNARRVF